jgi:hypothetical protein
VPIVVAPASAAALSTPERPRPGYGNAFFRRINVINILLGNMACANYFALVAASAIP